MRSTALRFLDKAQKKRNHLVAIDLGSRTTKAVSVQRQGDRFALLNYTIQPAPVFENGFSQDLMGAHLRLVCQALNPKSKQVSLAVGVSDALLRHAELPQVPVSDMRAMLKFNSKTYLQQDLPDHVFDCCILPPATKAPSSDPQKGTQKYRVLVGAAKKNLVTDLQGAVKAAGLIPETILPGMVGTANAFEVAQPELFAKESIALVDIGFRNSSIVILMSGELMLSRVVGIGGDRITIGLAEAMGITYAEAESIKIGMAGEVQSVLQALLSPLGRELRASIDFFEHQHDATVAQVFVSGGSALSEFIVQTLQTELMVPSMTWNPAGTFELALPPDKMSELEQAAPQLTVAVGTAAAEF